MSKFPADRKFACERSEASTCKNPGWIDVEEVESTKEPTSLVRMLVLATRLSGKKSSVSLMGEDSPSLAEAALRMFTLLQRLHDGVTVHPWRFDVGASGDKGRQGMEDRRGIRLAT